MIRNAPAKHPDSHKWYYLQWSKTELQDAAITAIAWTLPAGIISEAESFAQQTAGIKLSGGTLDTDYKLLLQITTSGGEVLHEEIMIRIRETGH